MAKCIPMPDGGLGSYDCDLDELSGLDAGQEHIASCLESRAKPVRVVQIEGDTFEVFPDGSIRVSCGGETCGVYYEVDDSFLCDNDPERYTADDYDVEIDTAKWNKLLGIE